LVSGTVPELEKPDISDDLYQLILSLTSIKPENRPSYDVIMSKLGIASEKLSERNPNEIYMKLLSREESVKEFNHYLLSDIPKED